MKPAVEAFSRAYEKATADKQAALRAWMRNIILHGIARRVDMDCFRRSEKESIEVRDRRILEFPRTISPKEVAKAVADCTAAGTIPQSEADNYVIVCGVFIHPAAKDDKNAELLTPKELHARSARLTEEHPVVLLLFPGKGAAAAPKLVARRGGHQVLLVRLPAAAGGSKGALDVGLTLIGTSPKAPE